MAGTAISRGSGSHDARGQELLHPGPPFRASPGSPRRRARCPGLKTPRLLCCLVLRPSSHRRSRCLPIDGLILRRGEFEPFVIYPSIFRVATCQASVRRGAHCTNSIRTSVTHFSFIITGSPPAVSRHEKAESLRAKKKKSLWGLFSFAIRLGTV